MNKINAGIIGITGYTGEELLKILLKHNHANLTSIAGRSADGPKTVRDIYPGINGIDIAYEPIDAETISKKVDVVFTALPHGVSLDIVPGFLAKGVRVVDLSADFRLTNPETYEKWYGKKHKAAEALKEAVYGLPELYRERIKNSRFVANPGCYPTSAILGCLPAIKNGLVDLSTIIIDSKSGVSGAGRKYVEDYMKNDHPDHKAYNIAGSHRHIPEIEQELSNTAGRAITVTFTPHIIPVERGMLTAVYSDLEHKASTGDILKLYRQFYAGEPFVRVLPEGELPRVRNVVNTNYCDIGLKVDERAGRLVVISAIDNLLKGASGQAVQNMNIMFGIDEKEGLA